MNFRNSFQWLWRLTPHILVLLLAIGYLILGGYLLCTIEGWAPDSKGTVSPQTNHSDHRRSAKEKLENLALVSSRDSTALEIYRAEMDAFLVTFYEEKEPFAGWTMLDGFMYSYSAVTTIGYSHLYTSTDLGRIFYVFYNVIGIPLGSLVFADWGLLVAEGLSALCRSILRALGARIGCFRKWSSRRSLLVPAESFFFLPIVLVLFLAYIALGGFLLPLWERDWSYVQGFYVAFDGVTTIGIGDIYPRNNDYFLATVIYFTIGIAIGCAAIGAVSDYLRVLHHAGTKPSDCRMEVIWFGGKHMRMERLTQVLGKEFGATEYEIRAVQDRLDAVINRAFEKNRGDDETAAIELGGRRRGKKGRRSASRDRWNDSVITPLTLVPVQNAAAAPSGGVFYGGGGGAEKRNNGAASDEDRERMFRGRRL